MLYDRYGRPKTTEQPNDDPVLTNTSTIYILRCGHILIDYKAKSSHAVMKHRRNCRRDGGYILDQDIIENVNGVSSLQIKKVILANTTIQERELLRKNGINV